MSRTLRLALLTLTVGLSTSCVENDVSVKLTHFLQIDKSLMCLVSTTQLDYATGGRVDTGLLSAVDRASGGGAGGYVAAVLIENNLLSTLTASSPERGSVDITDIEVQLQAHAGQVLPSLPGLTTPYFVSAAFGEIKPGGSLAAEFELIPKNTLLAVAASPFDPSWDRQLVAHARARGRHAGSRFETAFIDFPVTVCSGCLSRPNESCPPGGYESATVQKSACIVGQDAPVTCCMLGDSLRCGDQVPIAAAGSGADM